MKHFKLFKVAKGFYKMNGVQIIHQGKWWNVYNAFGKLKRSCLTLERAVNWVDANMI